MEWSQEDLQTAADRAAKEVDVQSQIRAFMTRAVELMAARGGTMTAERLGEVREGLSQGTGQDSTAEGRRRLGINAFAWLFEALEHLAALGARNAVLEAERDKARRGGNRLAADVMAWEKKARALESEKGTIRCRSLEAANLERLIAEHGLPTAMRWVVDGDEPGDDVDGRPYPQRMPHAFERWPDGSDTCHATTHYGNKCGWLEQDHRYPCSESCTHPDASTPGHPERVKERSEAFTSTVSPLFLSTEEDWDLELVEEALTEKPDSTVSNGARYWRRRFLKIVDRLGWVDMQTLSEKTNEARDDGAEAMRAACLTAVWEVLATEGLSMAVNNRLKAAIEGATP